MYGLSSWWDDFKAYNSGDAWGTVAADAYSKVQYGTFPQPAMPVIKAPQTREQMVTPGAWTPEQSAAGVIEDTTTETQRRIQAAIDSGEYNPDGNLPLDASGFQFAGVAFVVLAALVGGAILRRRFV